MIQSRIIKKNKSEHEAIICAQTQSIKALISSVYPKQKVTVKYQQYVRDNEIGVV